MCNLLINAYKKNYSLLVTKQTLLTEKFNIMKKNHLLLMVQLQKVKIWKKEFSELSHKTVQRFISECEIIYMLHHQCIIPIFGFNFGELVDVYSFEIIPFSLFQRFFSNDGRLSGGNDKQLMINSKAQSATASSSSGVIPFVAFAMLNFG